MLIEPVEPGNGAGSFFCCGLSLPSVLVSLILVGLRLICCWSGRGRPFTTTSFVTTLKEGVAKGSEKKGTTKAQSTQRKRKAFLCALCAFVVQGFYAFCDSLEGGNPLWDLHLRGEGRPSCLYKPFINAVRQ